MSHRKFNRTTNQRKALLSGLACNLVTHEQIVTTLPKAKEIRPFLEKIITLSRGTDKLSSFRNVYKKLRNKDASHKVVSDLSVRTQSRPGGYLRIIKAGFRHGDKAPMAVIEFVDKADKKKAQSLS